MIKNAQEIVKAKFVGPEYIMATTPEKVCLYDIRKPQIILMESCFEKTLTVEEDDEINDFDFK